MSALPFIVLRYLYCHVVECIVDAYKYKRTCKRESQESR